MAKKSTTSRSTTPSSYNKEVCEFRHAEIEKDFGELKGRIDEKTDGIRREMDNMHFEVLKAIDASKENVQIDTEKKVEKLKDKIIVTEKSMGEKIDTLTEFSRKVKGNGDPGVFEEIRHVKRWLKLLTSVITIMGILILGGQVSKVSLDGIKEKLFGKKPEVKQVEEQPEPLPAIGEEWGVDEEGHIIIESIHSDPPLSPAEMNTPSVVEDPNS